MGQKLNHLVAEEALSGGALRDEIKNGCVGDHVAA